MEENTEKKPQSVETPENSQELTENELEKSTGGAGVQKPVTSVDEGQRRSLSFF